ncbi:aminotransferase class V-fold PLP-dependent enzyme [Hamadaea sp. NPDC051192]|uniref:pyridoxal-phosphate-dependent aminotransferase family protein n=1 Tax=Hamadaea sp. NPDC051192 TaxID=3154940 RepID=UPI003420C684
MSIPLFTPGPVAVAAKVLQAQSATPIYHRSREYGALLTEVSQMLGDVLGTDADVYCLTASGTATIEAAVRNLCRPGDDIVVASNGYFGERLALMCERLKLDVTHVRGSWREPLPLEDVDRALAVTNAVAVLAVHHETSTGRVNDVAQIARLCRAGEALSIVDAISSAGTLPVDMDTHGLDVVIATSQKGIGGTPGIGVFAASEQAWSHVDRLPPCDSLSGDWTKVRDSFRRLPAESQWTPAISLMAGLHAALDDLLHRRPHATHMAERAAIGRALQAGLSAMKFEVWPAGAASVAPITVAELPPGLDATLAIAHLGQICSVTVGDGQGQLAGRVLRISHVGVELLHVLGLLGALAITVERHGSPASIDFSDVYRAYTGHAA